MKTLLILSILLITGTMASHSAMADVTNNSYSFNKLAQSLCDDAKSDQLFQFRSKLRRAKMHIRTIYPQISCQGQSLLSLAILNQSDSVVAYLKLRAQPEVNTEQKQLVTSK